MIQYDENAKLLCRQKFDMLEFLGSLSIGKLKSLSSYKKQRYTNLLKHHYIKSFKVLKYNTTSLYFQTCCNGIIRVMFPSSLLDDVICLIRDCKSVTEATNLRFLHVIKTKVTSSKAKNVLL